MRLLNKKPNEEAELVKLGNKGLTQLITRRSNLPPLVHRTKTWMCFREKIIRTTPCSEFCLHSNAMLAAMEENEVVINVGKRGKINEVDYDMPIKRYFEKLTD